MRVAMIGTGYVGLVSGACFADFGHHVVCVDKDQGKIAALELGVMPIYEPGLDDLVAANVKAKRLSFTTELKGPVAQAEAVFIAVGTPSRRGDGHADLTYVYAAAKEIAAALDGFTVVVTKSTVPVGTGDEVERIIREARPDAEFAVVSNPEFLREGAAIQDFKHPDRIVVGCEDARASKVMAELYRPLYINRSPILTTGRRTAELIKYAANAFLATKITFINEIADLCERVGADVQDVARGMGLDNRIGGKFLHAGAGYGGSLRGKTVAVLGLTFKPNTDDMRDAPSIPLITALHDMGAKVRAYDPVGMEQAKKVLPELTYCDDAYECAKGADALVIVTEWEQFRALDLDRLKEVMTERPAVVDLRNIYPPGDLAQRGFVYESIGRPSRREK
jgi:UDPglucose 6-dehydrogenase